MMTTDLRLEDAFDRLVDLVVERAPYAAWSISTGGGWTCEICGVTCRVWDMGATVMDSRLKFNDPRTKVLRDITRNVVAAVVLAGTTTQKSQ